MKRIKVSSPIELRLVLEIEPYHWSDRKVPAKGPARQYQDTWDSYFYDCMADAGITGIEPIQPGSHFVDALLVVENELMLRIIHEKLEGSGLPGFPNEHNQQDTKNIECVGILSGGYAIIGEGRVLLEPQCCCDFSNLDSWQTTLIQRPAHGKVWIGHPEAEVSFAEELVTIREGWECPPRPDYLVEFVLHWSDLRDAVKGAETARHELMVRLLRRVQEIISEPQLASAVCTQLMAL